MNRTFVIRFLAALLSLFTSSTGLRAQVPHLVNYQGRVAVGAVNFEGAGQFKFALVNGDGSVTFWSNDGTSSAGSEPVAAVPLTVTKGLYSVLLGDPSLASMNSIPASVWTNPDVRLRVWFNDGVHGSERLAPDQRLAPNGYLADASVTSPKLAPGAIGAVNIAPGSIGSAQLAGGAFAPPITVDGVTQAAPNTSYVATGDEPATINLPTNAQVGDVVRVSGAGPGGWQVASAPGQSIIGMGTSASQAGVTWTPRENARAWSSVASSADGSKLIAAVSGGLLYTSQDFGQTWAPQASINSWSAVASSSDGSKLVAVASTGQISLSQNGGATWTPQGSNLAWSAIASSADGVNLVGAVNGGKIYTSTDSGANWSSRESDRAWTSVASSADGQKLVAAARNDSVYISSDAGVNWTPRLSISALSVASSADGTVMAAGGVGAQIYVSTDSGLNWTRREINRDWSAIAVSADGRRMAAAARNSQLFTSADAGVTWVPRESNRAWSGLASSADGSRLVAIDAGPGRIYTSAGETLPNPLIGAAGTTVGLQYVGNNQWRALKEASAATADSVPAGVITTAVEPLLARQQATLSQWFKGPLPGKTICFVGDSTTMQLDGTGVGGAIDLGQNRAGSPLYGVVVKKFDANGQTAAGFIADQFGDHGLAATVALQADVYVLCYGINDVRQGGCDLPTLIARLKTIVNTLRTGVPKADIILRMPNSFLTTGAGYVVPNSSAQLYSTILRDAYRALQNTWPNVVLLDCQKLIYGETCLPSSPLMSDQIHPAVYDLMKSLVIQMLTQVTPATPGQYNEAASYRARMTNPTAPWTVDPAVLADPAYFDLIFEGIANNLTAGNLHFDLEGSLPPGIRAGVDDVVWPIGYNAFALTTEVGFQNLNGLRALQAPPQTVPFGNVVRIYRPKYYGSSLFQQYLTNQNYPFAMFCNVVAAGNGFLWIAPTDPQNSDIGQISTSDTVVIPSIGAGGTAFPLTGATFLDSGYCRISVGIDFTGATGRILLCGPKRNYLRATVAPGMERDGVFYVTSDGARTHVNGQGYNLPLATGFKSMRVVTAQLGAGGTVTVGDSTITANSIIRAERKAGGDSGVVGASYSKSVVAGASYTVTAMDGAGAPQTADRSILQILILEP